MVMTTPKITRRSTQRFPQLLKHRKSERGLSLVESVVSLLIFNIALAGIVPVFLNSAVATIRNEKRTAGIAVSQQVLDELRQADAAGLPQSGTQTLAKVTHLGKDYIPKVTYCQNATYCDANSRHIKIEIDQDGKSIYEAETVFTKFE